MRIDPEGRIVSVRGRQVHMTPADVAAFLVALANGIPEARFFDGTEADDGIMPELSRESPQIPGGSFPEVDIIFEKKPWEPEFARHNLEWRNLMIANYPRLNASIRPSSFGHSIIEGVGRKITCSTTGTLNANHFADDRDGKRIIDKMFRIHRKMVDNRTIIVDLRTGDFVREEKNYDWYGPDFATQCQVKKDHYLELTLVPNQDIYWGHLPVV